MAMATHEGLTGKLDDSRLQLGFGCVVGLALIMVSSFRYNLLKSFHKFICSKMWLMGHPACMVLSCFFPGGGKSKVQNNWLLQETRIQIIFEISRAICKRLTSCSYSLHRKYPNELGAASHNVLRFSAMLGPLNFPKAKKLTPKAEYGRDPASGWDLPMYPGASWQ